MTTRLTDALDARGRKVTVYAKGFLGYTRHEAKDLVVERKKYAQYSSAVSFQMRKTRERKYRGAVQTYHPTLVVLDGWGHFDPSKDTFEVTKSTTEMTVSVGRYSSCAPEWDIEFAAKLDAYVAKTDATVLRDYRKADTNNGSDGGRSLEDVAE